MSREIPLALALMLGGLPGCGDPVVEPAPSSAAPTPGPGWIEEIVAKPEVFTALVDASGREGWAALHRGDYLAAAEGLKTGLPAARAWAEREALDRDLSLLACETWERTFRAWEQRAVIPEDSAIPLVAALAAWEQGDAERAKAWLSRPLKGVELQEAARALSAGIAAPPGDGPLSTRLKAHLRDRAGEEIGGLVPPYAEPLLLEPSGEGTRTLWDPLVFGTLTRMHRRLGELAAGGPLAQGLGAAEPSLAAHLLSVWWGAAELQADLARDPELRSAGALGPSWLGPAPSPEDADDADAARARVAALDEALEGWKAGLEERASPEGRELLVGLDLVAGWRARQLVAWARAALQAGHPRQALVYAQLAQDLRSPRQIGPTNPPALYALMAHAELAQGHARQALDALTPLVAAEPLARGLSETLGDLAVLEGMGRLGDSKEN